MKQTKDLEFGIIIQLIEKEKYDKEKRKSVKPTCVDECELEII